MPRGIEKRNRGDIETIKPTRTQCFSNKLSNYIMYIQIVASTTNTVKANKEHVSGHFYK